MTEETDGLAIARRRIALEAEARTGFLDLGQLGLTELPEALFGLTHLRRLNLGAGFSGEGRQQIESKSNIASNTIEQLPRTLRKLTELRALSLSECRLADLEGIAELTALQLLDCSGTEISNLMPLARFSGLQWLDCRSTRVDDLAPLAGLSALQSLNCFNTAACDLTPLTGLFALQLLNCAGSQVHDLAPLKGLSNLQELHCSFSQVSDLTPLVSLFALQSLSCSFTQVGDLKPLARLFALKSLACSGTLVSDLTPLEALLTLRSLNFADTEVRDLAPLASLSALQSLCCSRTQVTDLAPLARISALQSFDSGSTKVNHIAPLAGHFRLQELSCPYTLVDDLSPLVGLPALKRVNVSGCSIQRFPLQLLENPSLQELYLYRGRIAGVPNAVLSQSHRHNCLDNVRAHFRDLAAGSAAVPDVKLMVLGNGRVGKTQLCRRLRGETYDDTVPSTHGVTVTTVPLAVADGEPATRLNVWDFGGQDIYHGTHGLFVRTRAVFLLAWTPELENRPKDDLDEVPVRNHPLAYWVDYVRHLAGADCPVLVVQTRCDRADDEAVCPVPESTLFDAFAFRRVLRYSARADRGRAALDEALAEAVTWLLEREGIAEIGVGRLTVQRRLEAMRDADAAAPPEARQHRTLTQAQFRQLCDEAGGIGSPDHLLTYLHHAGVVFYRPGLFDDAVILDQGWALEAIYAVLHRQKSYRNIRRLNGRFTRADLADWIWREQGHSAKEQALFLSMMQSCGICFAHRRWRADADDDAEYVAPDLLPDRAEIQVELDQKWEADRPAETAVFDYAMLHPGLMRSLTSRIGEEAGLAADYWKGGVYVYETTTRSRGLIEQEMSGDWQGRLRLQTQGGQAAILLERLRALVEKEQARAGLAPTTVTTTAAHRIRPDGAPDTEEKMTFGQEPSPAPEWCVSYAWGDDTPEGREREAIVDRLCAAAAAQKIRILRDKEAVGLGDRISKFMQRIGRSDRVFVVLSDKYLKSPFCMYELSEIWRNCRQDDNEFLQRIKVYTLPCAEIWQPVDRAKYAIYWQKQFGELEALVNEHGYDILGEKDWHHYRMMKGFSRDVGNILATVTDILQPQTFADLVQYGFEGIATATADTGS